MVTGHRHGAPRRPPPDRGRGDPPPDAHAHVPGRRPLPGHRIRPPNPAAPGTPRSAATAWARGGVHRGQSPRRRPRAVRHGFGRPPGYCCERERRRRGGGIGDGYSCATRSRDASARCARRSSCFGERNVGIGPTIGASALKVVGPTLASPRQPRGWCLRRTTSAFSPSCDGPLDRSWLGKEPHQFRRWPGPSSHRAANRPGRARRGAHNSRNRFTTGPQAIPSVTQHMRDVRLLGPGQPIAYEGTCSTKYDCRLRKYGLAWTTLQ